ncbi:uncharacterized protein K02A2.6-like [Melitaea cinxia]|uniref:uncharacterized protein K02A2.6-like n=1 Tax=Melitaea cinxia TaxID=113334 RepID=UPI001E2714EC|nr:uncharacterized protein K02A2.6-like [Melitaea cinxia]
MSIGRLSEFDVEAGNWELYCERLEMYFKANTIKDELKLPILISSVGDVAYELLVNLAVPRKPAELTFREAVTLLKDHLNPKPSILAERYIFRLRKQKMNEKIQCYVAQLKKLSRFCDFGATLNDNLRDQFVCGLRGDAIRQQLFASGDITFEKAVKTACVLEAAERDAAAVEAPDVGAGTSAVPSSAATCVSEAASTSRRSSTGLDSGLHRMQISGCWVCGDYRHRRLDCKFKNAKCSRCGQIGHLRRMCGGNSMMASFSTKKLGSGKGATRNRGKGDSVASHGEQTKWRPGALANSSNRGVTHTHWIEDQEEHEEQEVDEAMYQMSLSQYKPVRITLNVQKVNLTMEIDTGSPLSCINYKTYIKYFKKLPLLEANLSVNYYNLSRDNALGRLEVSVTYGKKNKLLDLYVFKVGATSLLGRQWLAEHKDLFDGTLGCFTGGRATLKLRVDAEPVFCRARPLPYALRPRVDAELDGMLRAGVIEPVDTSDWATPLVIVHKPDGSLRLCADYKVTLNKMLHVDRYPVPKVDDLFSRLRGSKYFTKLDLSQAYNQILLDDTRNLTVINTHRGLFVYNRLVYGLASSPGIFQRIMVKLFEGVPNVTVFLDDILIHDSCLDSHIDTVNRVLQILKGNGLKIKKQKCDFLCEEVKYLGFIVSSEGVRVDSEKIKPILEISPPCNVSELKSFLGMVNFYGKFIKNLSGTLFPLYELLKKGKHWSWGAEQDVAFKTVKRLLVSPEILVHYDESKPVVVTCDASGRGIGAVLAQADECGRERAVAYASRALTPAERNYSQIHREALAIVFAVKKFHQYLYGRHFILRTDHKPLTSIFGADSGIPSMTASRLQRWALLLSAYDFTIEYINTNNNGADALSRLMQGYKALNAKDVCEYEPEQTYLHFASEALLLNFETIRKETRKDPILSRIMSYVRDGWPKDIEIKEFKPYFNRRTELYYELGCLMWGHRLVVPKTCRNKILLELHDSHMGIVKTKAIARSYVWWPGIDEEIEACCRECAVCADVGDAPPRHAPQPWPWPVRPWTRLHIDFLGPIVGNKFLVIIDSSSKWIEVCKMKETTALAVITNLREIFARFGIPRQVVSDNGPPFSSVEFNNFLNNNGIEHCYSAPYHPSSNGAAENAVKICKKVIKKALKLRIDIECALQRYLLMYRNTEHHTTGECPAKILLGRSVRTRLDRIKPSRENLVLKAQQYQQRAAGGSHRTFNVGDTVWYRAYQGQSKWLQGRVKDIIGSTDYEIETTEGTVVHRHIDQMKLRSSSQNSDTKSKKWNTIVLESDHTAYPFAGSGGSSSRLNGDGVTDGTQLGEGGDGVPQGANDNSAMAQNIRRYPLRVRNAPDRYGFD